MSSMISPDNEKFLEQVIASGQFADRGAALDEAVRLLRKRDELRRAVEVGVEQLDDGRYTEYDETELDRFLADVKARSAARSQAK